MTALSLGLAYPFQVASLERYKMRNTFYGDLARPLHRLGLSPAAARISHVVPGVRAACRHCRRLLEVVDWAALADALEQSGGDVMSRIESGNPALAGVIVFAMLMGSAAVLAAALLYPAFQALVLRWWSSGLALRRRSSCAPLCAPARSTAPICASCGTRCCSASRWRRSACRHWRSSACSPATSRAAPAPKSWRPASCWSAT